MDKGQVGRTNGLTPPATSADRPDRGTLSPSMACRPLTTPSCPPTVGDRRPSPDRPVIS